MRVPARLGHVFATLLIAASLLTPQSPSQGRNDSTEHTLDSLRHGIDWRDDTQLDLFDVHGKKLHEARRPFLRHPSHGDSLAVVEAAPSVAVELRLRDVVFSDGVIELGGGGSSPGVHCTVDEPWGLRFRASKSGHYLLGVLGSQIALYRVVDGVKAKLATGDYDFSNFQTAPELRVEAEGPTIQVYHYDELFAEVHEASAGSRQAAHAQTHSHAQWKAGTRTPDTRSQDQPRQVGGGRFIRPGQLHRLSLVQHDR